MRAEATMRCYSRPSTSNRRSRREDNNLRFIGPTREAEENEGHVIKQEVKDEIKGKKRDPMAALDFFMFTD
ncbi:hypothetical protein FKM82_002232 [Ascaphus truei]